MSKDLEEYDGFSFGHEPEKPFELHQVYERKGDTKQVKCAKCGASELEVGCGDHFTVIRCPKCNHESCIHNG